MCFYRRRDLPLSLVQLADKHQSELLYFYIFSSNRKRRNTFFVFLVNCNAKINFLYFSSQLVAQAEDSDSPVALKLKKMWLKTPVNEEQAAQAVLDPAIGDMILHFCFSIDEKKKRKIRKKNFPRFFRNDFASHRE